jgi:hypothetical protein
MKDSNERTYLGVLASRAAATASTAASVGALAFMLMTGGASSALAGGDGGTADVNACNSGTCSSLGGSDCTGGCTCQSLGEYVGYTGCANSKQ